MLAALAPALYLLAGVVLGSSLQARTARRVADDASIKRIRDKLNDALDLEPYRVPPEPAPFAGFSYRVPDAPARLHDGDVAPSTNRREG